MLVNPNGLKVIISSTIPQKNARAYIQGSRFINVKHKSIIKTSGTVVIVPSKKSAIPKNIQVNVYIRYGESMTNTSVSFVTSKAFFISAA
jgi:hypothetical protein